MSNGNPLGMRKRGLRGTVRAVAAHASSIARLERELAAAELKEKAVALGLGAALLAVAAFLGLLMVAFALATIAAALALVVAWWLSLLIVTAALGLLAGVLALVGVSRLKKGSPPVPQLAIDEAKRTQAALQR